MSQAIARLLETVPTVLRCPMTAEGQLEYPNRRYITQLAQTDAEREAALRLRFAVFNVELGRGLAKSFARGRDEEKYDQQCDHLIVVDQVANQIVGTCRLLNVESSHAPEVLHSSRLFDLRRLPAEMIREGVEIGGVCVAKPFREKRTARLMLQFVQEYARNKRKRFMFGSAVLKSQDPMAGGLLFEWLQETGNVHPLFRVSPRPGSKCIFYKIGSSFRYRQLPSEFRSYLKLGAKVCGLPALNREFGTIDFFTVVDLNATSHTRWSVAKSDGCATGEGSLKKLIHVA